MATLVLSTVGTALGGPVGGAIGSLIGQGIDQELLGSGPRKGPRLGDLSVQTSSYGSAIPKVFGTMRVAGNIIWSTDLVESSETQAAKDASATVAYTYSVSLAVAVSSRAIRDIGRIWADGNLIRTPDGKFTIPTVFRILGGSADQDIDPLIGSIEGVDNTPAYRGLAIVVFDQLQLASFGNRIPFFTFEVIADEEPVPLPATLSELSGGVIQAASDRTVLGFAAYGETIAAAVEPLISAFGIDLVDNGQVLDASATEVVLFDSADTGCSADEAQAPRVERSQVSSTALPSVVTVAYYEPERDYQSNIARAALDTRGHSIEQFELPAVIDVSTAKSLAETALARRWSERDRMTIRLPQNYLNLRPGARLQRSDQNDAWKARRVTLESMCVVVEMSPACDNAPAMTGDAGRVLPSSPSISAPTTLTLLELPDDGSGAADRPVVAIAASGSSISVPVQIEVGPSEYSIRAAPAGTIVGRALSAIAAGQSALVDLGNRVDIQLDDEQGWLESCDLDALASGKNLALLGNELVQFGDAEALGGGAFRLSRLLRGRAGSEWAMADHFVGERFVLLERSRLEFLPLTAAQTGAVLRATPCGLADVNAQAVEIAITGEALRPPSPSHVRAAFAADESLECTWVRRSRRGWAWLDGVDAPLGCSRELYRVTLSGEGGSVVTETPVPQASFDATQISALGAGSLQLSVVQIGDLAVSRPASRTIARS